MRRPINEAPGRGDGSGARVSPTANSFATVPQRAANAQVGKTPPHKPHGNGALAARAKYLAAIPSMYRKLTERAFAGTASPRMAIRAKCLACVGHIRADVTNCTAILCELHPLRPYQQPRREGVDSIAGSTQHRGT
jgi:hypothetical protein